MKNPTRKGFGFTGWSGTGLTGSNNMTVTIPKGSTGNRSYTAHWQADMTSIESMQQMTSEICAATAVGTSKNLTDTRDSNVYSVKKLKDGNCWMTQNLRLANRNITSVDSNLPSGTAWTVPASSTNGFGTDDTNSVYIDSTHGGYYSFFAATAGWGTSSVTKSNAPQDICPKGWRLPASKDFGELVDKYNTVSLLMGEPSITLSGYRGNRNVEEQGSLGLYRSSTVDSSGNSIELYLDSRYQNDPAPYYYMMDKTYGMPIRCVAK